MQKPTPGPFWRTLGWVLVPLYHPEYRRLLIRSYVLSARLELLCTLFAIVSPFATPAVLRVIRRWLDHLRDDVAEFGRRVRMPRAPVTIPCARVTPQISAETEFRNPWI
jgi:hypothetical protein